MASQSTNSLAGLLQMNDRNVLDLGITDLLQDAPVLNVLAAVEASDGLYHKYLRGTVAAGAGFRAINSGISNAAAQEEVVTHELKFMDASFTRDVALCRGYVKGPEAFMAREGTSAWKAAFSGVEKRIFTLLANGDTLGFLGLADQLANLNNSQVLNASGSGSTTTSVYIVRSTPDSVAVVAGDAGKLTIGDVYEVETRDGSNRPYSAYRQTIGGYLGFQFGSTYSAVRIANITSAKPLSDGLIAEALSAFPAGRGATHIICNRTSLMQLQKGRTATNPTGAPAPFPSEAFGVPIVVTDSIGNAEAALTT